MLQCCFLAATVRWLGRHAVSCAIIEPDDRRKAQRDQRDEPVFRRVPRITTSIAVVMALPAMPLLFRNT
jgi:hypothetical protein